SATPWATSASRTTRSSPRSEDISALAENEPAVLWRRRASMCAVMLPLLLVWPIALTSAAGASTPALPSQDPFYRYSGPKRLETMPPGTVLKRRSVQLAFGPGNSTPVRAEQLLYRTTGPRGQPTARV